MGLPQSHSELQIESLKLHLAWLPQVAAWHSEGFQRGQSWTQSQRRQNLNKRLEQLRLHVQSDDVPLTLVAHRDGLLCGCLSLVCYQRLGGLAPSYWIANVFVDPSQRCRGIAAELMASAEALSENQSIRELYLYATDQVNYYRNLGWQVVREKTVAGTKASIMRKTLCAR